MDDKQQKIYGDEIKKQNELFIKGIILWRIKKLNSKGDNQLFFNLNELGGFMTSEENVKLFKEFHSEWLIEHKISWIWHNGFTGSESWIGLYNTVKITNKWLKYLNLLIQDNIPPKQLEFMVKLLAFHKDMRWDWDLILPDDFELLDLVKPVFLKWANYLIILFYFEIVWAIELENITEEYKHKNDRNYYYKNILSIKYLRDFDNPYFLDKEDTLRFSRGVCYSLKERTFHYWLLKYVLAWHKHREWIIRILSEVGDFCNAENMNNYWLKISDLTLRNNLDNINKWLRKKFKLPHSYSIFTSWWWYMQYRLNHE